MCTVSPDVVTSGLRKWSKAVMAAIEAQSRRFPPSSRMMMLHFIFQTFSPALMQSASVSIALLSRRPRSMTLPNSIAYSEGRPSSNEGDAIGENSVLKRKKPSVGLSGKGSTTSLVTATKTLPTEKIVQKKDLTPAWMNYWPLVPCLTELRLHMATLSTKRDSNHPEVIYSPTINAFSLLKALPQEFFVIDAEVHSHSFAAFCSW